MPFSTLVDRDAPVAPPALAWHPAHAEVVLEGNRYFIPDYARHRPAARSLMSGRLYEPKTHAFVAGLCARAAGPIVHAGAFFGDMLPNFSAAAQGQVLAFEPVLENYLLARLCVEANALDNVLLFHAALSSGFGQARVCTRDADGQHAGGSSHLIAGAARGEGVPCTTMPIDCLDLAGVVLIQLDVEGHELSVLKGARRTIARHRPVIAVEDNEEACAPFLIRQGYLRLGQIPGLTIWVPEGEGPLALAGRAAFEGL